VRDKVDALRDRHDLSNAALVAMEPRSGQVLAMVGSADYWNDEIDGRVNVAVRERQPGSSIKPITYVTALEQGLPTSTMLWDVPMRVDTPQGLYEPKNYDLRFHGPVRLRTALANSYNIPALKLLQQVGIEAMIDTAHRMGITGLNRGLEFYGLSVTLGGGEVKLLDMTTAFATLANGGGLVRPNPVLAIADSDGRTVYALAEDDVALEPEPAVGAGAAYITSHILSDNRARLPAFGNDRTTMEIGVPAAVKTGTTNDYRDNWTVGYTPYLVTGVWAGNSDNSPMRNSSGVTGAAPIWNAFMRQVVHEPERRAVVQQAREALGFDFTTEFRRPPDVVEAAVCNLSSLNQLSDGCPSYQTELFLAGTLRGLQASDAGPRRSPRDVWITTPAVVMRTLLPPEAATQAEGEPPPGPAERLSLCRPGDDGFGTELARTVAVLPLPEEERERQFVIEWAESSGWAALAPAQACTPEMVAAAAAGGGGAEGAADLLLAARTEYRLRLEPGSVVSTTLPLYGTVVYDPNAIEYYKVELGSGTQPTEWITIGDVHHGPVRDGPLETLAASGLAPGDYVVRLVLVKKDGNFLNPPYSVPIRVQR
jgi:hypothetical protein